MIAAQRGHHGAAARAGRHDGAAHGIPHVHEAHRPGCVGADALHQRALGAQRGEVMADAAALLHGERGFLDVVEDGAEVVLDAAHHEAIEEGDVAARAGAGQDASRRQEGEIGHGLGEGLLPALAGALGLGGGDRGGHARPGILQAMIDGAAIDRLQAVLHVPDLLGNRRNSGGLAGHRGLITENDESPGNIGLVRPMGQLNVLFMFSFRIGCRWSPRERLRRSAAAADWAWRGPPRSAARRRPRCGTGSAGEPRRAAVPRGRAPGSR